MNIIILFHLGGNDRILNIGFIFYLTATCMGPRVSFVLGPLGIIPFLSFIILFFPLEALVVLRNYV